MIDRILLKQEDSRKIKYKINFKNKKSKFKEINYNFGIKLLLPILIILIYFGIKATLFKKKKQKNDYFACFCSMARKENKYARELISYYTNIGVEKFIFGDNNLNGTEKLADVLEDYINNGIIDIHELFGSDIGQSEWFQIIYQKYKKKCKWFLFYDFDEYLNVHFENNKSLKLQDFLTNKTFDKCEAVLFNWLMYTDNDLIYYDNRKLIERFTTPNYNDIANAYVKSIVRGGLNKTIFYPKKSSHVPDANIKSCNSIGTIIERYNPFTVSPYEYRYGELKHFATKSAEEFVDKTKRGTNRNIYHKPEDRLGVYFRINKFTEEKLKFFEEKFNRSFSRILYKIKKNLR